MRSLALAAAVAAFSLARPAAADTTAATTIAQVMVLEAGDTSYKLFHGAVWIDVDKATVNYRWGGLQCKGRDIGDTSIQILFAAFKSGDSVKLEYVVSDYKDKQYRCVTGFTISK
jgi:hypothetical protein